MFNNSISKFLNFLISITILLAIVYFPVFADEAGQNDFVYLFHLYYDNGRLSADRDFEFKYDVIPESYVPEIFTTQFPFKGEVVNFKNEIAAQFLFDPKRNKPDFFKGKILVKAPYIADGQKVIFYDSQNKPLLTVFVSESSFCDDDGICNSDRGEDTRTCPNDCRETTPSPTVPGGAINGQGGMMKIIIYGLIVLGALTGGWFGWKWWRRKKKFDPNPTISLNQ